MIRNLLMAAEPWTPKQLFANSEVGVWFDPSNRATLFQDSAGTTPVTATGQSVGRILDLSGNNKHATQSTSDQKPTYEIDSHGLPYLRFDGSNDWMTFPTLGTGLKRAIWALWNLRNTGTVDVLLENSVNYNSYPGAWLCDREMGSPVALTICQKFSAYAYNIGYVSDQKIDTLKAYRIEMDRQTSSDYQEQRKVWVNRIAQTVTLASPHNNSMQNIDFYNGAHYLGARSGGTFAPAQLNFYGLAMVNTIHADATKALADTYFMQKGNL